MSLRALQGDFRARLLGEAPTHDTAYDAGLRVYHNAYRTRLLELLRRTFEKTWTWVGDDAFESSARTHISLHPPASWTLDDYGSGFPATLEALFPDAPEVADLAWLEAAIHRAFGSPDSAPLTSDELSSGDLPDRDWEDTRFGLVTSVQTRLVGTNCVDIWRAIASQSDPPDQIMRAEPATLCVWRKDLSPLFRVLDRDEEAGFAMIAKQASFGEICERLGAGISAQDAATAVGTLLGRWIGDGMLAAFPRR